MKPCFIVQQTLSYCISLRVRPLVIWDLRLLRYRSILHHDLSLNAFALPGNFIGINKGLIASIDDHRELLAVFCHELAHLTQRHLSRLYKSQKDSSDIMLLTLLSAIILGVAEPDAAACSRCRFGRIRCGYRGRRCCLWRRWRGRQRQLRR